MTSQHHPTPWLPRHVDASAGVPDTTGLVRSAILHADGTLYLERFEVLATPEVTIRLHHWHQGDDQRAAHDHPWANATTVLAGHLVEHAGGVATELTPGCVVVRRAEQAHRLELVSADAWTLFVTGPITRRWGFHTTDGWVHWQDWPYAGSYETAPASRTW